MFWSGPLLCKIPLAGHSCLGWVTRAVVVPLVDHLLIRHLLIGRSLVVGWLVLLIRHSLVVGRLVIGRSVGWCCVPRAHWATRPSDDLSGRHAYNRISLSRVSFSWHLADWISELRAISLHGCCSIKRRASWKSRVSDQDRLAKVPCRSMGQTPTNTKTII